MMSSLSFSSFSRALTLGGIPALCMLVATCIGLGKKVPPSVAGALQHFAAGVLLCTIGTELLPEMVQAQGLLENVCMGIGFFLGMAVLIFLGSVLPAPVVSSSSLEEEEENDENGDAEGQKQITATSSKNETELLTIPRNVSSTQLNKRLRQRQSLMSSAFQLTSTNGPCFRRFSNNDGNTATTVPTTEEEYEDTGQEERSLLLKHQNVALLKPFPSALVLAVAIDSALDGLLIGIASAAGPSAGPMMSISLSVEMGFLGLTLAAALHGHDMSKSLPASILGPLVLVLGAGIGGFTAATLKRDPALFVGLLSFGTSALLFMVAEELLLEAHEQGQHLWWVDLQLYTGFFCSILVGKAIPTA